jgi:RimJ/RimL family protein N-acetyltransferase
VIQEIKFEHFPWDEMPWARNAPGENRLKTNEAKPEFPVLILWKNDRRVAYLCYYIFDAVNIVYAETHPDFVKRGYATELVDEVCRRYHREFDIKAQSTCTDADASVRLLKRCGFERVTQGLTNWILRKGG